jgi:peroxiredoxin
MRTVGIVFSAFAMFAFAAIALAAFSLAPLVPAQAAETTDSPVGKTIAPFELPDYLGTPHALADLADKKAVVVVFLGTECPLAKLYAGRLAELAAKYEPLGVAFLGINANQQDSLAKIAHYARQHKIEFPILKDAGNVVADRFGAQRTPEAFVLDAGRVVRYWGRIDDQYGVGYARPSPEKNYVAAALDELLAGKPVSQPQVEPVGCHIGRASRTPPTGEITYTKHVAALLHHNCVRCHRAGEVAPFSLETYADAAAWAETIREVIDDGRMPPWHANPQHGKFWNDARLADEDKRLIFAWVENGCPQGDAAELPKLPPFPEGWQIDKPDVVYQIPQPFQVPAKGTVEYQYFTIDPGFKEDTWIKAAEARPGTRAVTHHLILFFHPPGSAEIEPIEPLFNSIAGFAPGMPPAVYPDGVYRRVPAGSKLIIQAHYTPNGSPQQDQSEFGLVFADPKEVKQEYQVQAALSWQFVIPPGAKDHRVQATYKFDQDSLLHALTPHMHLRGKSFLYEAVYPDGREEILLDVPRYDFNWQNTYALAEPQPMPSGTVIRCTATFDNSAANLANPNPNAAVRWGDQTWQEMMVGTLGFTLAEQDLTQGPPKLKRLDSGEYEVTFAYRPAGKPEAVYLAGTFNDWKPDELRMDGPDADGRYVRRMQLKPGAYEYKFVIDGSDWKSDPGNPRQMGFYRNSVVQVGE